MITHGACGASWTAAGAQHCGGCHETFVGTASGDAHRVGDYEDRRCLSPDEMRARMVGDKPKPLIQDSRGLWRLDGPPRDPSTWPSKDSEETLDE